VNDEPGVPELKKDRAARLLRALADECDLNSYARFQGCFLVVPPEGDPKDLMLLSDTVTTVVFWANLKTMAEMAIREIDAENAHGGGAFRR
jgi:hypothetical protein